MLKSTPARGGFRGVALAFVETFRADEMSFPDTGAHFRVCTERGGVRVGRKEGRELQLLEGPLSMGFHYLP